MTTITLAQRETSLTVTLAGSTSSRAAGSSAGSSAQASAASVVAVATSSAVTVDLSDQAKSLLQQLGGDEASSLDLTPNFGETVRKRNDALAGKLTEAFAALHLPTDEAISLRVDKSGKVTSDGPFRDTIEKYFKDNPDAATEFKTVATLNALEAAQEAMRLFNAEKWAARTDDQRNAAWARYTTRSMNIQALSGRFTLDQGKLGSAAMDYAQSLSEPGVDPLAGRLIVSA